MGTEAGKEGTMNPENDAARRAGIRLLEAARGIRQHRR